MSRLHLYILTLSITAIGLGLFGYKALILKLPLREGEHANSWLVETKVSFYAQGRPIKINLALPSNNSHYLIADENFISRGYGLTTQTSHSNRSSTWSIRQADGSQTLYYRAVVQERANTEETEEFSNINNLESEDEEFQGAELEAANDLITEVKQKSADTESFIRAMIKAFNRRNPNEAVTLLVGKTPSNLKKADTISKLLRLSGLTAHVVQGVRLLEQVSNAEIEPRIEVKDVKWTSYDPSSGEIEVPGNYMRWWFGSQPLVSVKGAERLRTEVGIKRYEEDALVHAVEVGKLANPFLLDFSLFSSPIQNQAVYKVLLLIPIGAFIVVILRNLVGIRTFGTFMPVLIALSFRETQLFWGLFLFSLLIAMGLLIRFYLEHLKLLLVPRLGSILCCVVIMMAMLSVITHRLGIGMGLSVALFPMIIITLSIERMCIVWDELGPWSAIKQGSNTLLVATLIYLVISLRPLEYLIFVFPELILPILAMIILMGRYTGYRLLELGRFKDLTKSI